MCARARACVCNIFTINMLEVKFYMFAPMMNVFISISVSVSACASVCMFTCICVCIRALACVCAYVHHILSHVYI